LIPIKSAAAGQEGQALRPGDEVTVTGRLDRDRQASRRLEAASVFVRNRGTYYRASGADEEDLRSGGGSLRGLSFGSVEARGHVVSVGLGEFMLASAHGDIRVDVSRLGDNLRDDQGAQRIGVGDRVFVWGDFDPGPMEAPQIRAEGLVTILPDRTKRFER